ncbi:single-stranded-DNA-specific exonuclease RecJ [Polaribacter sp.]|jgi:single-stranded-DNA-specific exonuclease|nr:single-stranded-DNA-specific exonuclease RecJ [Polaribacter sp.]MDB9778057.1 single-stranded-DNA-specific exonuclease RecJ [Polaribacter sp.]MDB9847746.1 single-stranded-DNA-specific exonuclease RecJ [Polaribacter sp.]MDB9887934.1 single-stranded-DNA-specific exonuclease RecJ [Polaribacter sp.]MDC0087207.1 single-stranded-DNA-specific exonuclease RecJ [Polaribacter sp.]
MRWSSKPKIEKEKIAKLAKDLSVETTVAKILLQRNISTFEEAKKFFRPSLDDLHDPFLMKDMDVAVERIETAIRNQENILVFGDYDVDGTSAVSLVASYLKTIYPNISTYIPDRYEEGYGVSFKGIDFAEDNNFSLIIALDCGTKALEKVAYATEKKIDFIICDHHKPGAELPKAVAILNPKRADCYYPFDELCGCGVGFKLIQALGKNRQQSIADFVPYLDLVATAIAADIVPINGENRTLAYFGLQVINSNPRNGIKAIIHQTKKEVLTITDVVFIVAPRINAAGRMKHGNYAVELLTEMDFDSAVEFAAAIEIFNADRKDLDKKITNEALMQIIDNAEEDRFTSVVYKQDWHKGVIGIVASRLIEKHYRPTLVFTKSGDKLAASARSVKGFDVYNALLACEEFIEQFGGHKYAAGLTLLPKNFEKFKAKFEEVVRSSIPKELLTPEILIDAEIELSEITPKFFRIIQQMAPFGPQNRKPIFKTSGVRDNGYGKQVGADKTHLKLNIIAGADSKTYNAIGFNLGSKITEIQNAFDIVYALDENEWNGVKSIQLLLKDLK